MIEMGKYNFKSRSLKKGCLLFVTFLLPKQHSA